MLLLTTSIIIFIFNGLPMLLSVPLLEQIKTNGELVILTRNSPTTYYEGRDGPAGFEYELAKMFADELGVELTIVIPESLGDLLDGVTVGSAHMAAAGLTVTEPRKKFFHFGPSYQEITEQLVYHVNHHRPASLSDLQGGSLEVVANSSHSERLAHHKVKHADLIWKENHDLESEELLQLISDEVIDYTIADSNEVLLNRRFLIKLRVAFDISEPQQLAWAFKKDDDDSLINAANKFFAKIKANGQLDQIIERSYSHAENLNVVDTVIYLRQVAKQFPKYRDLFVDAGEKYNVDWYLIAAMGYQESHWNPKARSKTGVRGIMMLTKRTAAQLGVKDRLDPVSSVDGGTRYFLQTLNRLPQSIQEPDRTWMAMAAYNVGFGHLEDARVITEKLGKDPDKWIDVKEALPLLAKRKWYKKTKYGYARGAEPVRYVENIRSYYDILTWLNENEQPTEPEPDVFSTTPNVP